MPCCKKVKTDQKLKSRGPEGSKDFIYQICETKMMYKKSEFNISVRYTINRADKELSLVH